MALKNNTAKVEQNLTMALKNNTAKVEQNLTMALKNNTAISRPDWLLYVIPSIAFVLGLFLFSMVYRTQRRREKEFRRVAALKAIMKKTSAGHTYTRYTSQGPMGTANKDSSKLHNSSKTQGNLTKQEAQSYENVTAVIYSNEDKVNYCVLPDDDYLTPDAVADKVTETNNTTYLQAPRNLTDTDGESYENMEGCVYAHPRQSTLRNAISTEDDDYINPDEENKHNLEQTDTESYENMAGSACPNAQAHTNTHTVDEGWYECMDRRQRVERHT
ncbi:uncharacterized protein LOC108273013 isoform X1 [Ictalurus punctatus]|uniref:Uncharacterized protein LOC108273013 isoform X1 n=2 Tax=Ictalurus punctatus TaxID=7998 RepID=A0A9F7TP36_ICTPU|nr:uncharacterized protein LOC108273013 isoform X1 [Ictalurus punctatus]